MRPAIRRELRVAGDGLGEMIRVAFIIASFNVGGAERQLLTLLRRLDRNRVELGLFVMGSGGLLQDVPSDVSVESGLSSSGADLGAVGVLADALRKFAPDVVIQYGRTAAGLVGRLAARRAGVPVIAQAVHSNEFSARTPKRWLHNRLNRLVDGSTDAWICVSRSQEKRLLAAGVPADRMRLIPNGVDLHEFSPVDQAAAIADGSGPVRVVAVGGFRPVKRYDVLVDALGQAIGNGADLHVSFAGAGETLEAVKMRVGQLGLAENVSFLGERDDVAALLRDSDILVSTSDSESSSLVAVEAMGCCLPVLATRSGGIEEIVVDGETGILVPAGDVSALGQALVRLGAERELRRRMGLAGRARALSMFSVETMVSKYEDLIEELACLSR